MILTIPKLLTPEQLARVGEALAGADWVDGRATAGHQSGRVKHNQQLAETSLLARELSAIVLAALEHSALFVSAALPHKVFPPLFNRYEGGQHFGAHVDNAIRMLGGSNLRLRTDLSATLFLSEPDTYEGGELLIEDTYGAHSVKLPAGDLVLYPASSLHKVAPVTRGARVASFFWVQSMVRDDGARTLLFDLDSSIRQLTADVPEHRALLMLTATYHNLLRRWSEL